MAAGSGIVKLTTVAPSRRASPKMMTWSALIWAKSGRGPITSFIPPKTLNRSGCIASASASWPVRISCIRKPRMARFAYSSGSSWASAMCWANRSAQPLYPP